MEITVGGHYHVRRRLGAGSFGEVFLGEDVTNHEEVAIKMEPVKARAPQLLYESKLYLLFAGGVCVPRLHWFGTEANYHVLVMDYLGKSLEDLFQMCHQKFSLKTVLMIADQTIAALEYLHNKSFIHRDVKPDNFLIGANDRASQIFVIDFGLSKKYRDPRTHEHIKYAQGKSLTGTARYASINALKGYEQARRDDLESIGYCLLYFLRGSLPWMGLDAKDRKQKYERICDVKCSTPVEELCAGYPEEFAKYLNAVRDLRFNDTPDYGQYRQWFRDLFIRMGYVYDYQYDWVSLNTRRREKSAEVPQQKPEEPRKAAPQKPVINTPEEQPVASLRKTATQQCYAAKPAAPNHPEGEPVPLVETKIANKSAPDATRVVAKPVVKSKIPMAGKPLGFGVDKGSGFGIKRDARTTGMGFGSSRTGLRGTPK